jgi:hypothetical protein
MTDNYFPQVKKQKESAGEHRNLINTSLRSGETVPGQDVSGIAESRKPPWGASPPGAEAVIVKVQGDYFLDCPDISEFLQELRNSRQPLSRSSPDTCSINAIMCFFF